MTRYVSTVIICINALLSVILLVSLLPISNEWIGVVSNFWPYFAILLLVLSLCGIMLGTVSINILGVVLSLYVGFLVFKSADQQADVGQVENIHLKVLTFNVFETNRHPEDLAQFLEAEKADFVFVEEAEGLYAALDGLRGAYPYQTEPYIGCDRPPDTSCDTIILSRHPLEDVERPLTPAGRDRFLITTTIVEGRRLTLAGVHLTKPLQAGQQAEEIELIGRHVRELPRPLLVAGDFNATPWSKAVSRFKQLAEVRHPNGYHPTWPIWLPGLGLPIDHIMVSGDLSVLNRTTHKDPLGSNHLPLLATLALGGRPR